MHVSPAKHSYASVTDRQTDGRTDGQTDDGQSDPYVSLCFAGDTKTTLPLLQNRDLAIIINIMNSQGVYFTLPSYIIC